MWSVVTLLDCLVGLTSAQTCVTYLFEFYKVVFSVFNVLLKCFLFVFLHSRSSLKCFLFVFLHSRSSILFLLHVIHLLFIISENSVDYFFP